ncbi:hypothetical protein D7U91_14265 [Stenotrophomonas maltophilia]|nr:hypothetical protein [Stenotrophomonas maltophilia]MBA0392800.1 hypothetical protein [Stenotrophomonas maltophilia]MBA0465803.1 hypothetical protein [Stenotrophomonas maltophilia]MBA0473684.1 hypothetical protein [Stenotrophomonas maltophilia]
MAGRTFESLCKYLEHPANTGARCGIALKLADDGGQGVAHQWDVFALGVQADCRDINGLLADIGSSGHEKTSGQKCKYASHLRMLLEVGYYLQRADVLRQ